MLEMRKAAGPSRQVQCVLSGGPYTVSSHVWHVHVVWPPPCPRQKLASGLLLPVTTEVGSRYVRPS
jgi:hypothetical protein